jgi:hypothetical protein
MAYSSFNTKLQRLANAANDNCPSIWTYITTDSLATVGTSGYFNAVAGKLKVGDLVYVTSAASPWLAGLMIVKSNTRNITAQPPVSGVVDLFNATVVNVTINSA